MAQYELPAGHSKTPAKPAGKKRPTSEPVPTTPIWPKKSATLEISSYLASKWWHSMQSLSAFLKVWDLRGWPAEHNGSFFLVHPNVGTFDGKAYRHFYPLQRQRENSVLNLPASTREHSQALALARNFTLRLPRAKERRVSGEQLSQALRSWRALERGRKILKELELNNTA